METLLPHLLSRCDEAVLAAEGLLIAAKTGLRADLTADGRIYSAALDREQRATHALAWYATYVEALRQLARWARQLNHEKRLGEIERLILEAAFGEYLAQMAGGIPLSQNEIARPGDMGRGDDDVSGFLTPAVKELIALGTRRETRGAIADLMERNPG